MQEERRYKDIDRMAEFLSEKYFALEIEDIKDILNAFGEQCKEDMLAGNTIKIKNFGEFCSKIKNESKVKNIFRQDKIKPEMVVPFFKTARKLRNFINRENGR